jgi:hypothetical protein
MWRSTERLAAGVVLACLGLAGCRPAIRTLPDVGAQRREPAASASRAEPIDATTLEGKLLMGYQGWFGCPGDGSLL